ncbi:MAG TPA: glycosyltransferase [Ohtaekwangia sp.]
MVKILCIGEEWKGSNASGLFYALSRAGCVTSIVNEQRYISLAAGAFHVRAIHRAIRHFQVADFNTRLRQITNSFLPDLVLVYKGAFLKKETVLFWREQRIPVVNFFPDVSFMAHGSLIPEVIRFYDHIFTTKTFGAADLQRNFGIDSDKVTFIPHGFDPQVHRKIPVIDDGHKFLCDASFIGGYTPNKYTFLKSLSERIPALNLKIWGNGWGGVQQEFPRAVQGIPITGDLYVYGINASTINIALLSEQVAGASSGDRITSRTFHIPGSGGFMLHERTDEVLQYFDEGRDMACFSSPEELADKTQYYLNHEQEREVIRQNGYERALRDYSLDHTATRFLKTLKERGVIRQVQRKYS